MPRLSDCKLVYLDVETTGLFPAMGDRVVEIALIASRGRRRQGCLSRLVNPGMPIPADVQRIHGITDADVSGQPEFSEIAGEVARIIDGAWLIGHCLRFDIGFLAMELTLAGRKAGPAGCLDTCQLARATWDLPDYRLDTIARVLSLRRQPQHRAAGDAAVTRDVFHRIVRQLGGWRSVSISQLLHLHGYPPQWPQSAEDYLPPEMYDALATGRPVRIQYVNGGGEGSKRVIRPVACFAIGRWVYVKAQCEQVGELRTFRLDRIALRPNGTHR